MNDYLLSVLLGIVEGLTEFLPVSSTAHLRISEALFHVSLDDPYWKMYTIVIQLGAILALLLLFWHRVVGYLKTFPKGKHGDRTWMNHPVTLTLVAFVCTAGPAKVLDKVIGKNLESLAVIGWALLVGGIVMWAVDTWASKQQHHATHVEGMTLGQAVWIGLCQVLAAAVPGTSRSMSTIAAGQLARLSRETALEFSFLVSIPTMVAATGYALLKALHPKPEPGAEAIAPLVMTSHGWIVLAIGFVVSFIVAYGVVAWFLAWVRKRGFTPFAIYRVVVGAGLLVWLKMHG